MSPAYAGAVYFRESWPNAIDAEAWTLARRILNAGGRLAQHDESFVRAMAALALTRELTTAESGRLLLIAMRAGVAT
jgi:hypothetical protein